ncbi:hypothetical protein C5167_016416 [Papaver somniferum]|nr:hypothetical protein C5167_016416 [Papaver somniferum]
MMEAATDETKAHEFVKFFVMFLLVSVFVPNKGRRSLDAKYLYMVFDMNKVCWPEAFHDYLFESVIDSDGDVGNVVGCVIYPLYWVAEMTMIAKKKDGLNRYPRFSRWNLSNVCQQILENFEGFSDKKYLYSEKNMRRRKGSFLLQYDEKEKRLVERIDEEDIELPVEYNVADHIAKNEVPAPVEDNAANKDNSYEAKYRWARMIIENLTTVGNNELSEEDKAVLEKYDAEVGFQPSLKIYSRRKRKRGQVDLLHKEDVRSEQEKVSNVEVVKDAAAEDEMMHIAGKHLLHEGTEQEHLMHEGTEQECGDVVERVQPSEEMIQGYVAFLMEPEKVSIPGNVVEDVLMEPERVSLSGDAKKSGNVVSSLDAEPQQGIEESDKEQGQGGV